MSYKISTPGVIPASNTRFVQGWRGGWQGANSAAYARAGTAGYVAARNIRIPVGAIVRYGNTTYKLIANVGKGIARLAHNSGRIVEAPFSKLQQVKNMKGAQRPRNNNMGRKSRTRKTTTTRRKGPNMRTRVATAGKKAIASYERAAEHVARKVTRPPKNTTFTGRPLSQKKQKAANENYERRVQTNAGRIAYGLPVAAAATGLAFKKRKEE